MITYRNIKGEDLTPDEVDANFRDLALGKANISVYDPNSKNASAFDMANMDESASSKILTDTEREKLAGIAADANKYSHPANHLPSVIAQDANNRFVTDADILTLNDAEAKFAKNNAFNKTFGVIVGTVAQGNDSRILNAIPAYDRSIVSASITGDANKVLTITKQDGTTVAANFTDNEGIPIDDVVNSLDFTTATGVITALTEEGFDITVNIDGRYSLLGHTHSAEDVGAEPKIDDPLSDDQVIVRNIDGSERFEDHGYTNTEVDSKDDATLAAANAFTNQEIIKGVYGIEYDRTIAAPEVTRIGDMEMHATLPVQSKMRRCLQADDGTVNYYLDANDSTLREDGAAAILDGAHGQVMVEIPEHWEKFEIELKINRALFSENSFYGAHFVPKMYVSAYKAALKRTGSILSSVVNSTAEYRGGNNSATNDANAATLLGKPSSRISRINYRDYAQNRGSEWFDMDYQARKTIYWLITIEYATRNHQTATNANLTAEGYRQGALGTGPTNLSGGDWSTFNNYYPLYNCGLTNSLGNNTGEIPVVLQDFPTAGLTKATQANSYRGIENFFGDIWEWTNGINIKIEGGLGSAYVANGFKKSDIDYLGYKSAGNLPNGNGYISEIQFGEFGDIIPKSATGASSTTFFSDYFYLGSDGLRGLRFGGRANTGSSAGSACVYSTYSPSAASATIGSRLCFFAR